MNVEINALAVVLSGISAMVIGFLWYSPTLFGRQWMKLEGVSRDDIERKKGEMGKTYGIVFVTSLIMAYVLSHFATYVGARDVTTGMQVGFWAWLGFIATTMLTGILFSGKPVKLYLINNGYHLVTLLVMGAILAVVR